MTDITTPPGYPFPDDEILYPRQSDWSGFDLNTDSYFALGRLPEDHTHVFNDREHHNYLRFVIRTPEKGSAAMLCNHGDMQHLLALALRGALDTQSEVRTDPVDEPQVSLEWLAMMVGEDAGDIFA